MRLMFIGESWLGSNARTTSEALIRSSRCEVLVFNTESYFPKSSSRLVRLAGRVFHKSNVSRISRDIISTVEKWRPEFVIVYKGWGLSAQLIQSIRLSGSCPVLCFPDAPSVLKTSHDRDPEFIPSFDRVVVAKSNILPLLRGYVGYHGDVIHVRHGYDPVLHYASRPASNFDFDLILCATWRKSYDDIIHFLAGCNSIRRLRVALAGLGWKRRSSRLPGHWHITSAQSGVNYGNFIRRGSIAIAPIDIESGDLETARTYELPAMNVAVLHQRTAVTEELFSSISESCLWSEAESLRTLVLELTQERDRIDHVRRVGHAIAMESFGADLRARDILDGLERAGRAD